MKRTASTLLSSLWVLAIVAGVARAADPPGAADVAREVARLQAEVTKLQQELREQRQLILNVMQSEQQRYEVLLQLVRSGAAGSALPAVPPMPAVPAAVAAAAERSDKGMAARFGTISGKASLPPGVAEAYVYVDGLRGRPGGKTLEIVQKDKQFVPAVAVVTVGTKLVFPNQDSIFHNVFSNSPGQAFDLGSVKGGERSRPVAVTKPGHFEVFCNIHSKMRADVLVVPGPHFARVAPDGSFSLPGIPAGARKVVLWAPGAQPSSQVVEVTAAGAHVSLTAGKQAVRPHLNKTGQAYGSYDE